MQEIVFCNVENHSWKENTLKIKNSGMFYHSWSNIQSWEDFFKKAIKYLKL